MFNWFCLRAGRASSASCSPDVESSFLVYYFLGRSYAVSPFARVCKSHRELELADAFCKGSDISVLGTFQA